MAALAEPGARGSGWVGGETRKMRRRARRAGPWGAATHRQHPPRPLNRAPGPDGDDANVAALVDALADDASSDERRIAAAERLRDLLMDSAKAGRMGVDVGVGGKGWWAKMVGTALLTLARASPPTGAGATPVPVLTRPAWPWAPWACPPCARRYASTGPTLPQCGACWSAWPWPWASVPARRWRVGRPRARSTPNCFRGAATT